MVGLKLWNIRKRHVVIFFIGKIQTRMEWSAWNISLLVIVVVSFIYLSIAMLLVLILGENQPLKARSPISLAVLPVINLILIAFACLSSMFKLPDCESSLILQYSFFILLGHFYLHRAVILFVRFRLVDERIVLYEMLTDNQNKGLFTETPIPDATLQDRPVASKSHRHSINTQVNILARNPKLLMDFSQANLGLADVNDSKGQHSVPRVKVLAPRMTDNEEEEETPLNATSTFWFLRNSWIVHRIPRLLVFAAVSILLFVPAIVEFILYDKDLEADGFCYFPISEYVINFYIVSFVLAIFYLAYLLHGAQYAENFGIRKELLQTVFGVILIHIPYIIVLQISYAGKSSNPSFTQLEAIRITAIALFTTFYACFKPAYKAFYKQEKFLKRLANEEPATLARINSKKVSDIGVSAEEKSEIQDQLIEYLETKNGFNKFAKFAKGEFCVENVLFWKEAGKYKNLVESIMEEDPSKGGFLQREAEQLYATFIAPQSPLQINISYNHSLEIANKLGMEHKFYPSNSEGTSHIFNGTIGTTGSRRWSLSDQHRGGRLPSFLIGSIRKSSSPEEGLRYIPIGELLVLFDEAVHEIMRLLSLDLFRRYRMTAEYKRWASKRRRQKSAGNALKAEDFV